ncbi:Mu transposase C-terminal domain-containing protein [Bacillus sp. N1-1]|uniref:Mu transposase C-terminal domain-containing protein n=1 Tax=Bacillus sp. N1-1 TaxID=2682541 RepID=UPI0013163E14|nr:Mu transposase C-terminal domain-containing protein [Bacillus sp. N1-1]QHA90171.1 DDE-type integrase/transposase/recombinase [Bacillus sp. N1-1]
MFLINDVIQVEGANGEKQVERILWIDEGYKVCYSIDIRAKSAMPIKRRLSDLEQLHKEQLLSILNENEYDFIYQQEDQLSEKSKLLRDERWEAIENLVLAEPDIYEKSKRGKLIKKAAKTTNKNKRHLYRYLHQYWQRGQVKNALLPDYFKSGNRGVEKPPTNKKNGRRKKFGELVGEGIVITDEVKRIFEISIRRYYHKASKNPLSTTYELMLKKFFVADYRYDNGVKKPILLDEDKLPTLRQFRYWYTKTYKSEEKLRKRKGNRKYELEDRAVLGSSVRDLYGPGSKFQIDATVGDVYLVSSFNRNWIIGRPVIYVVIDVFSRMVVGLYVGLEGPSWNGAMMALANTASDKVAYCKEYGIDITQDDWACSSLPETLLADRGELEGYNINRLTSSLNIKVENTPPYRGDWKGIVERHFKTINQKVKPFLPGFVDTDVKVRGDRDYRLDATLTLDEFTSIIIRSVLYHNNEHWLEKYNQDEMLIRDDVSLIPRDLWNWGIRNRSGKLRYYPEHLVKFHLLPSGNARVTGQGIVFKKMRYSCEKGLREGWFEDARQKSWRIPISYDPRNMGYLYLHGDDNQAFEIASLLDHQKKYDGKAFEDVQYLFDHESMKQQLNHHHETQQKVDLASDIDHIVQNAKKASQREKESMSNSERVKNIRENRAYEKEARRKEESFLIQESEQDKLVTSSVESIDHLESKADSSKIDILRQKQKERLNRAKRS